MQHYQSKNISPVIASMDRSFKWLLESFNYFCKDWLAWLGINVIFSLILLLAIFQNYIAVLVHFLLPILIGGLMIGCHAQSRNERLTIKHLFTGLTQGTAQLLIIGVIYSLGELIIIGVVLYLMIYFVGGYAELLNHIDIIMMAITSLDIILLANQIEQIRIFILISELTAMILYLPLLMMVWFAPALVVLNGLNSIEAMRFSFKACLINTVPFLIYGLVGMVLALLATLPLGLGWIILIPMMISSIYISYQDIFTISEN